MKNSVKKEYLLSRLLKSEHTGKWVAVSLDYKKVIGYSSNLSELEKRAGKEAVYTRGLSSDFRYSFYGMDKV